VKIVAHTQVDVVVVVDAAVVDDVVVHIIYTNTSHIVYAVKFVEVVDAMHMHAIYIVNIVHVHHTIHIIHVAHAIGATITAISVYAAQVHAVVRMHAPMAPSS
jgi:hypothetical protein